MAAEEQHGSKVYDYFERMDEIMRKTLNPVQNPLKEEFLYKKVEHEGKIVENMARTYHCEKLKHISLSKLVVHGVVQSHNFSIFPDGNYDLPFFGTDIVIFDKMIVCFCDLQPYIRDEESVQKYITPMKPLYEKYKHIPNEMPRGRDWLAEISSNFGLSVTTTDVSYVEEAFRGAMEYFQLFTTYLKKAEPLKDEKRKEEIKKGREHVIAMYTEYDPGYGPMKKYFGKEWTDYYFHNILFAGA
ncbi:MAG: hypothetical protein HZA77_10040 [Candidatus Schekmanbacteria bacterium]|nr:hypothetical protein [Candidatus Schekmanbacteria bacterium]